MIFLILIIFFISLIFLSIFNFFICEVLLRYNNFLNANKFYFSENINGLLTSSNLINAITILQKVLFSVRSNN